MGWRIGSRSIAVAILLCLTQNPGAFAQPASFDKLLADCANVQDDAALPRAINACNKVIASGKLDTKNLSIAYFSRGTAFHFGKPRDYTRAIIDYTEAIRLDPTFVSAYHGRGLAHWLGPKWDLASAAADFDTVIRLEPGNMLAWGDRCSVLALQRKRLDQALSDCNRALNASDQPELFSMRALVHFTRKDYRSALADFEAALRYYPRSADALYARGVTRVRLGDVVEGQKDIETAMRLDQAVAQRSAEINIAP